MKELVQLLHKLLAKVSWLSEAEQTEAMDLLRAVETALEVAGVVPPKPVDTNVGPGTAPVVDPGPVADTTPPADFVPPASPEVATAQPEATNTFSGTAVGTVTPPDAGT
jgi:hypothetical protein